MRRQKGIRTLLVSALATCAGAVVAPTGGQAQSALPRYGVGYVSSAPDMLAGVGAYLVRPAFGGLGIFADFKFDLESPSREGEFREGITAREVEEEIEGAQFVTDDKSWRGFNLGVVRPVTPSLMLYAGAGYAIRTQYRSYVVEDALEFFWVEDPGERKTTINTMFGGFMRVGSHVAFQIGFETAPRGLTVGAFLGFPEW